MLKVTDKDKLELNACLVGLVMVEMLCVICCVSWFGS